MRALSWVLIALVAGCQTEVSDPSQRQSGGSVPESGRGATGSLEAIETLTEPFEFALSVETPIILGEDDRNAVTRLLEQLASPANWHPSRALHVMRPLRYHRSEALSSRVPTILSAFLDDGRAREQFGDSVAVSTRWGLRYPTRQVGRVAQSSVGNESHRDQTLAALAELGLAPRTRILAADGTYSLEDVLKDSLAGFHLDQKELAWTVAAFAALLQSRAWTNRFGERCDFDRVTKELLRRGYEEGSCGGTHGLQTLTLVLLRDQRFPVLSQPVRDLLTAELRRCAEMIEQTQSADGSWSENWSHPAKGNSTKDGSRLVVTSHLTEWILLLPPGARPANRCLEAAVAWLLRRVRDDKKWDIETDFCPLSHAALVLLVVEGCVPQQF